MVPSRTELALDTSTLTTATRPCPEPSSPDVNDNLPPVSALARSRNDVPPNTTISWRSLGERSPSARQMISAPTPAGSPIVIPIRCVAMLYASRQFGVIPEDFATSDHFL